MEPFPQTGILKAQIEWPQNILMGKRHSDVLCSVNSLFLFPQMNITDAEFKPGSSHVGVLRKLCYSSLCECKAIRLKSKLFFCFWKDETNTAAYL